MARTAAGAVGGFVRGGRERPQPGATPLGGTQIGDLTGEPHCEREGHAVEHVLGPARNTEDLQAGRRHRQEVHRDHGAGDVEAARPERRCAQECPGVGREQEARAERRIARAEPRTR